MQCLKKTYGKRSEKASSVWGCLPMSRRVCSQPRIGGSQGNRERTSSGKKKGTSLQAHSRPEKASLEMSEDANSTRQNVFNQSEKKTGGGEDLCHEVEGTQQCPFTGIRGTVGSNAVKGRGVGRGSIKSQIGGYRKEKRRNCIFTRTKVD